MAYLQKASSKSQFPFSPIPSTTPSTGTLADTLASSRTLESSLACSSCGGFGKGCPRCSKQQFPHPSSFTRLVHQKQPDYGSGAHQDTNSNEDTSFLPSPNESIRCECHQPKHLVNNAGESSKRARNKLIIACAIALAFTVAEVLGGYFSHSLAIMTDAAHMLSDFASFLISLFSIWMASLPPSKRMSFGWHRAEVVGAVISVLIIWLVTGVLVYEAILRIIHRDSSIDANIMLITACLSVFVNVFMCTILGHGHSHGGGHSHSHGDMKHTPHSHCEAEEDSPLRKEGRKKKADTRNINVRAAFIHTIGDLIQSLGVLLAAYIIKFRPDWYFADPICTFVFSILVMISTITVLRDAMLVLMEGTPRHINYESVLRDLNNIDGVKLAHNLHIWSLTMNKTAAATHLALDPSAETQEVLDRASTMLQNLHGIDHTTLQVEKYQEAMKNCQFCQGRSKIVPQGRNKAASGKDV